ncbi:MAG: VOC family protein [Actinomycetota bacterium]|jgi:catechol-2,3-dioxygenase|nr:VOC family protein [Actinomycetota bacterium]
MFEDAIGMAVLAASDLSRAQRFWHDVFGLDPVMTEEDAATYVIGGIPVLVYESQFAGTAKSTTLSILTDDLDRDMAALRERGVTFNDYDFGDLKTVDGVADLGGERGAWFDDTEGNIIAIAQPEGDTLERARALRSSRA